MTATVRPVEFFIHPFSLLESKHFVWSAVRIPLKHGIDCPRISVGIDDDCFSLYADPDVSVIGEVQITADAVVDGRPHGLISVLLDEEDRLV